MKYIGVLRDTARAPKPTTQYNTIQYPYMEKTCDVAETAILAKKIGGKSA